MNNENRVYLDSQGGAYQLKKPSNNGVSFGQMALGAVAAAGFTVGGMSMASNPPHGESGEVSRVEDTANQNTQELSDERSNNNLANQVINYFTTFEINDCECEDESQKQNNSKQQEESQRQELLDKMAQTEDIFRVKSNSDESSQLGEYRVLEINRDKQGSQGERLKGKLEGILEGDGHITIEGIDPRYEVKNGEIVSPTGDFSKQINTHFRNAQEDQATITYNTQQASQESDSINQGDSSENEAGNETQRSAIIMINDPRRDTAQPYVLEEKGNTYTATRLLYTQDDTIHSSQNQEDTIENLTKEDIANLTYQVWSNPKLNELTQPTRDSVYFQNQGLIENTSHDMLRKGVDTLEGRICSSDNQQENCIEREDMTNAFGVSAVYQHAAQKSLEDISGTIETPFYGHLKGDNSNVGSWVVSTVLSGDDWIAQSLTHYTGNVLNGEQKSQYKAMREECSQKDSPRAIFECVDTKTQGIIDTMPKYQEGGN